MVSELKAACSLNYDLPDYVSRNEFTHCGSFYFDWNSLESVKNCRS